MPVRTPERLGVGMPGRAPLEVRVTVLVEVDVTPALTLAAGAAIWRRPVWVTVTLAGPLASPAPV